MKSEFQDWEGNGFAVRLAVTPEELDGLMANLAALRRDHDQHFHISRNSDARVGLGDIEISVMGPGQAHNMSVTSVALPPGAEIPDPPRVASRGKLSPARPILAGLFGLVGSFAMLIGASAAYITIIDGNYRPMLISGVWQIAIGFLAFHASTGIARSWKGRAVAFVGALFCLAALVELLRRLAR